jgi:hypothetical protein
MSDRDLIEYFQVELETHEVIFAEGVAAETLLVINGRENFASFVEYERLCENTPRPPMKPFAPYLGYAGGRPNSKDYDCRRLRPDPQGS